MNWYLNGNELTNQFIDPYINGLVQDWSVSPSDNELPNQIIDPYIDGLVRDYSISIANALEILQSCIKSSIGVNRSWIEYPHWITQCAELVWRSINKNLFAFCHFLTLRWHRWQYHPCERPGSVYSTYRKTSGISRTKSQNLNVSCILLQLSSPNPLKPGAKLRMKM